MSQQHPTNHHADNHKGDPVSNNSTPEDTASTQTIASTQIKRGAVRVRRLIKNTVRSLIYVPLGILLLVALLVATPFGSHISVFVADKFVPGLSLEYQSGSLNSDLSVTDVSWHNDMVDVAVNQARLDWRPWCLIKAAVCVNALQADGVTVKLTTAKNASAAPAADATPTADSAAFSLPFSIQLSSAKLSNIDVAINAGRYQAAEVNLSANWQKSGLTVERLTSDKLAVNIPRSTTPDNNTDTGWPLAQLPTIQLPFPIAVNMARLQNSSLTLADNKQQIPLLVLLANMQQSQLALGQLTVVHKLGAISVKGDADLSGNYPLKLQAQVAMATLPAALKVRTSSTNDKKAKVNNKANAPHQDDNMVQDALLSLSGSLADLTVRAELDGSQQGKLDAHIDLTDAQLPYRVHLAGHKLQWPFNQPQYRAENLVFASEGNLNEQHADINGQLFSPFVSAITLNGSLVNKNQQVHIKQLAVNTDAGSIALDGQLDYSKGISWQINSQLQQLDLSALQLLQQPPANATARNNTADTPNSGYQLPESNISGPLHSQGFYRDGHWQVALNDVALSGVADQLPFSIQGDIRANDSLKLHTNRLSITALNSKLFMQGSAGDDWNLHGQVDIPDLAQWLPQAYGSFTSKLAVSGDAKQPKVTLVGQLNNAGYQNYKVSAVTIDGNYQPFKAHAFQLALSSGEIAKGQQLLGALNAKLGGDLHQQQFDVALAGDYPLQLQGSNQYDNKQQKIALKVSKLATQGKFGDWQLAKPVTLDYQFASQQHAAQGTLAPFCITSTDNQLCLTDDVNLADPRLKLNYHGKPSTALAAFLPEGIEWHGDASMNATLHLPPQAKPTAEVKFSLAPGVITFTQQTKNSETVRYQDGVISATLDDDWLHTTMTLDAGDLVKVNANLDIATAPTHQLQGNVQLERFNLKFFEQVIPQFQTLEGLLNTDVSISGTLAQPLISGSAKLASGALVLSNNPTRIDEVALTANFDGQHVNLDGNWRMGKGKAQVSGDIHWPNGKAIGEIKVRGDKLTVIQPPLAIVDVSPDLTVNLGDTIHVSGNVAIPTGSITISSLPAGGVSKSSDVVFDDTESERTAQQVATPITADVDVSIGDKLAIDGYGLKAMLNGTVNVRQAAGKPAQVYGNISLKDGTYKFMSQTLTISRGELQFVGPPQVPTLNIEATREIKDEDLVAGVRITGNALKPQVTLFSNPAREQAEVLSYILQGKGFDSTEDNSSMMIGAAVSLGSQFSGGGSAMGNISNTAAGLVEMFGFNNVQLDTDNEGKVAISGYIGKDLMLKYGVGVFTPGYEVTVRYYLLSQLYLESVSSTIGQSLDIYYSFDIEGDKDDIDDDTAKSPPDDAAAKPADNRASASGN